MTVFMCDGLTDSIKSGTLGLFELFSYLLEFHHNMRKIDNILCLVNHSS